jgi:acetolactate synthase-1/2/3 large subunit
MFFDKRYASTEMINPDFITIAKGYNIDAKKVSKRVELKSSVQKMMSSKKPYFLEVRVEKEANVFPMIPSGASVSEVRLE